MAILPPRKGSKRGPSLTENVVMDVTRGVPRARIWPRPRKSQQTPEQKDQNEWFRQANWAFKYAAPEYQVFLRNATHRTSLYPRDLFTIAASNGLFALTQTDGKVIYPVPYIQAVSQSLDALSQEPGSILVRGPQWWEAKPLPQVLTEGAEMNIIGPLTGTPASTDTIISWSTPTISPIGWWDPANPSRLTVSEEGWYRSVFGLAKVAGNITYQAIAIFKNGTQVSRTSQRPASATANSWHNVTADMYLNPNDYIQFVVYMNATGSSLENLRATLVRL